MSEVQSIDRVVQILRCFTARTPRLGVSDIARATGLSTSTTHRLLAAMQQNRLVRQSPDRTYALGSLLVQLVLSGAATHNLRDAALPAMSALRDTTGETAAVHELLPSDERAVLDQVESHHELRRTYTEFGVPIPLTYGAPGKSLLAFIPEERRAAIFARPIAPVTAGTITSIEAMEKELQLARERGFAVSVAERTPGIGTVAATVFDHTGHAIGSLSISGPEVRMPYERLVELGPALRRAAWNVSQSLGATTEVLPRDATIVSCA